MDFSERLRVLRRHGFDDVLAAALLGVEPAGVVSNAFDPGVLPATPLWRLGEDLPVGPGCPVFEIEAFQLQSDDDWNTTVTGAGFVVADGFAWGIGSFAVESVPDGANAGTLLVFALPDELAPACVGNTTTGGYHDYEGASLYNYFRMSYDTVHSSFPGNVAFDRATVGESYDHLRVGDFVNLSGLSFPLKSRFTIV